MSKTHPLGEELGPMFFVVYDLGAGVWSSKAFWHVADANAFASERMAYGHTAFVEFR